MVARVVCLCVYLRGGGVSAFLSQCLLNDKETNVGSGRTMVAQSLTHAPTMLSTHTHHTDNRDRFILSRLHAAASECDKCLRDYEFGKLTQARAVSFSPIQRAERKGDGRSFFPLLSP